jgi:hypothetical protein
MRREKLRWLEEESLDGQVQVYETPGKNGGQSKAVRGLLEWAGLACN